MSRMLFKGPFIPYFPDLQAKVGTHGSLILSVIGYLLYENANQGLNYKDGRYWVYKEDGNGNPFTMKDWRTTYFPGDGLNTIIRAFERLEQAGLLISGCFNEDKRNRTKWYTINFAKYDALMEEIDNSDEVWRELRKADLKNAFTQNGQKGRMGDTEDDYGKSPLKPSNNAFTQNGQMQTPKMGKCNIYIEKKKKKPQAADELKEHEEKEEPLAYPVPLDLKLEGAYREEALAKFSEKRVDELTREFIDYHIAHKTKRVVWQGYCRTFIINKYKSEQKSPTRATPSAATAETTPAQEDWSRIRKEVNAWKGTRQISEAGWFYLKLSSLNSDCLVVEALESVKSSINVQQCHEFISGAINRLKIQINRVEFKWL